MIPLKMTIAEAKKTGLVEYLASLGLQPKIAGERKKYKSTKTY
jgi:hypothetical protein